MVIKFVLKLIQVNFIRYSNTCLEGEYLDKTNSNLCVKNCDKYYKEDRTTKEK